MRVSWQKCFGLIAALMLALLVVERAIGGPLGELLAPRRAQQHEGTDAGSLDAGEVTRGTIELPPGATVERNVAYGNDPAQRLDVYRPGKATVAPLIVMVHGGGWRFGDKGASSVVKNKVAHWVGKGAVLVSLNYRLLPAANPVSQADDVGRALVFIQNQARGWGVDPARLVLIGHSSGAHLVALLTADGTLAAQHGLKPWLASVLLDSAALDIEAIMSRRHFGLYDQAFGSDPALWRQASPMRRLGGKPAAPMLLVCSARRSDSCPPAREFAAKAVGFGGQASVLSIDLPHGQINSELGSVGAYTDAVDDFVRSQGVR